jgi:hypothetical protein
MRSAYVERNGRKELATGQVGDLVQAILSIDAQRIAAAS